jgi:hypothetical protein
MQKEALKEKSRKSKNIKKNQSCFRRFNRGKNKKKSEQSDFLFSRSVDKNQKNTIIKQKLLMELSLKNKDDWGECKFTVLQIPKHFYLKIQSLYGNDHTEVVHEDVRYDTTNITVNNLTATTALCRTEEMREFSLWTHEWRGEERYESDHSLKLAEKKKIISFSTRFMGCENPKFYNGLSYKNRPLEVALHTTMHLGPCMSQIDGRSKYLELIRWVLWEFEKFRKEIFEE